MLRTHLHRDLLVLSCVALLVAGCSPPAPVGGKANNSTSANLASTGTASAASAEFKYESPSEEEAQAIAQQIEDSIMVSGAGFGDLVDWDALLHRATVGTELPPADLLGFLAGVKQSVNGPMGVQANLLKAIQNGGKYHFLRVHEKDGMKRAMFRMVAPAGLNYHDLVLAKKPNGEICIVDMYVFVSGEMLSETIRRGAMAFASQQNRTLLQKLTGKHSDMVKSLPAVQSMSQNVQSGNFQQALAIYKTLPPSVQEDKTILLLRYHAAQQISVEELVAAANDFRHLHPDDPCLDLLLIDHYAVQRDYQAARDAIDRLDEEVQDPYLHVLRCGIYNLEGNTAEAERHRQLAEEAGVSL